MDLHEVQRELNRRLERESSRLEQLIQQELAKRLAVLGRQQNPRLARTIADPAATPTYPEEGSGANVFPIVFLNGGFTHTAGVQTGQFTQHRATPQCKVFCTNGQYLPEGSIIEVWQDRGVNATYPGEWWTASRPCLPERLVVNVRTTSTELIQDVWFPGQACDTYVPYVLAEFSDCFYSPYTPDETPTTYFAGEDETAAFLDWEGFHDDPDPSPWIHFLNGDDWEAYFMPESDAENGAHGVHCIELTVTVGSSGGFFQFEYIIDGDLAASGYEALICDVDGTEVFNELAEGAGIAGPFVLTPGAHTIRFCINTETATDVPFSGLFLAKVNALTIWGT